LALKPELSPIEIHAPRARRREQRVLWRLGAWGTAAAVALISAALASQTETGRERLQLALNGTNAPTASIGVAAAERRADEAQAETRRLAAKLRELSADRDRLGARLATLERNLAEVTGSIRRQIAVARETPAPAAAGPAVPPAIATTKPKPTPRTVPAIMAPLFMPASEVAAPFRTELLQQPAAKPLAPLAAASPPPPAAAAAPPKAPVKVEVPMPPVRVATLAARHRPPRPKPEYAVDIGGGLSITFLRAHWAEVKANFGPLLAGLSPVVRRDGRFGHAPYRLLVGPLPNVAAVARLCAQLTADRVACRPAQFAGEPLAQP